MPEFVTKPIKIQAIKFTGKNLEEIWEEFGEIGISFEGSPDHPQHLILWTADGNEIPCSPGMWVMKDSKPNTFYPCNDEHFQMKYEEYKGPLAEIIMTVKYPMNADSYQSEDPQGMLEEDLEMLHGGEISIEDLVSGSGDDKVTWTGRVL